MDPALLLDAIQECDEDDADEEEDVAEFAADAADIPQCFSHFTYDATNGKKLVCDVQGVWNHGHRRIHPHRPCGALCFSSWSPSSQRRN
jgi:hypothetical protein